MGGGDLNLKKSWHPSTMKNMERVWKAEQQDNEEKKRIAELQKEIAMEKDREELQSLTKEKKDDKKLDWMYKPHNTVDREQYLLGRSVDKQFEDLNQAEKAAEQNKPIRNHVEHECIPPSIRNFQGDEQVDLARKLQEDPLYAIKKKETESRAQLLKNPVKLKQLRQLLEQEKREDNKSSKKKKSEDDNLDVLLAAKFKKLKNKISEKDLIKSLKKDKKLKKHKKKKTRDSSSDSDSSSESDEPQRKSSKKHKRKSRNRDSSSDSDSSSESNERQRKSSKKHKRKSRNRDTSSDSDEPRKKKEKSSSKHKKKSSYRDTSPDNEFLSQHLPGFGLMRADGTKIALNRRPSPKEERVEKKDVKKEQKWVPPKRTKLSEEEKERRRREMLSNATEHDKQRKKIVERYEDEEKKEAANQKSFDKEFLQKTLAKAAFQETVASRIKSNMNNIQRGTYSMDRNFARR